MSKTSVKDLRDSIMSELKKYEQVSVETLEKSTNKVSKKGVDKLKEKSQKKSGVYAKGWSRKVTKSNLKTKTVIHNKKKPGLTHLLENGHQLRNGGRSRKFTHIKPVEEYCIKELEKAVIEGLKNDDV